MAKSRNTRHYHKQGKDSTCSIVGRVLSRSPRTRSNDRVLMFKVYELILRSRGKLDSSTSALAVFRMGCDEDLPSQATISHWRRWYQAQQKYLPGDPHVAIARDRHRDSAMRRSTGWVTCPQCTGDLFCPTCDARTAVERASQPLVLHEEPAAAGNEDFGLELGPDEFDDGEEPLAA